MGDLTTHAIPKLSRVTIEGLHDQFDIDISFKPGLNIIYGKNGLGKTTLLHLLANALELDFKRFSFLSFRNITIKNDREEQVDLRKIEGSSLPRVFINNASTDYSDSNPHLSEAEEQSLRSILGARSTYLPAFRSVLERTRDTLTSYNYRPDRKDAEFDQTLERELSTLRESAQRIAQQVPWDPRLSQEEAVTTTNKTVLCRQWFGRFVPVIRYPSVADVDDGLTEEWRSAHLNVTRREQRMFEETFINVFRAIAGSDGMPTPSENNDNLLNAISQLLSDEESRSQGIDSRDVYNSLRQAAQSMSSQKAALRGVDNSLLLMYRDVLEKRNAERRTAFQRSRDFEAAVNNFLDGKQLRIGSPRPPSARSRSAVAVTTKGGHSYGLSALSSGERQIVTMLYSATRTRLVNGAFLIDEPELSLHVDWQRIVLREIERLADGRQIIACTHSPEVGADHLDSAEEFDPRIVSKQQSTLFPDDDF